MRLIVPRFGEAIRWHLRGGNPGGGDPFCLYFLLQPTIMDVDMLQTSR